MVKETKRYLRLDFYVPSTHLEQLKRSLFEAGAGRLGNYDCCCWETLGRGQFRPMEGSKPFIGSEMIVEKVDEYKVEIIFSADIKAQVLEALKKSHPYEEPAYQIIEISLD